MRYTSDDKSGTVSGLVVETGDRFSPNDPRANVTMEALCRAPDGTIIRTPTGGTGVATCTAPNAWVFAEGTGFTTNYGEKWTQVTPQATLEWTITPEVFAYLTYSEGFKGGGFDDTPANVAQATTPFDPEEAKNYEVGIKSDFFDNRFRVNADVFYMDYTNLQVTQTNAACLCNITDNAASAEIKGVEAEFSYCRSRACDSRCPARSSMRSTRTSWNQRSIRRRAGSWTARTIACSARPRRRSPASSTTRWASAAGVRR